MSILNYNLGFKFFIKRHPVTAGILLINTVMLILTYVLSYFHGATIFQPISITALIDLGALTYTGIGNGEYYRVVTAMFLHASLLHYLGNMIIGVYVLGSAVERLLGSRKFVIIYFLSGLIASLTVVLYNILFPPLFESVTVGASGAIFGVLGALLYITIYRKDYLSTQDIQSIRALVVINIIFTFISFSNVSIPGHVGGMVGGFLLSYLLIPRDMFKVLH